MKRTAGTRWSFVLLESILMLCLLMLGAACGTSKVTMRFQTNGGSAIADIEANAGEGITPPADPVKEGFVFDGWYLTSDFSGTKETIPSVMPEKDVTYYAKWKETATVSVALDPGSGGTMAQTSYQTAAGSSLSAFLKDKTPQAKEGLTFKGWFTKSGDVYTAVAEDATVPEEGIALYAQYDASVNIEIYLQNADGSWPEAPETQTETATYESAYAYSAEAPEHYVLDETKANKLSSDKVAAGETFSVYYKRKTHYVLFDANAPEGAVITGETEAVEALYGATIRLPENVYTVVSGDFRQSGWQTGTDPILLAGEEYTVENDVVLYAVWNEGLHDLFGGSDVIYLLAEKEGTAILVRGGIEVEGTVENGTATFAFGNSSYVVYLHGSGFAAYHEDYAGTFTYYDTFYNPDPDADPIVQGVTLDLDGMHQATYRVVDGDSRESNGIYSFDPADGYFLFEGEDGFAFRFMLGTVGGVPVFIAYYESERGTYNEFVITDYGDMSGYLTSTTIELDGSGGAVYVTPGTYSDTRINGSYYRYDTVYFESGDYIDFIVAEFEGEEIYFETLSLSDGIMGFVVRNEDLCGDFKGSVDGKEATLTLDGYGFFADSVQLTVGEETAEGFFDAVSVVESLGGYVIHVELGGEKETYFVKGETFTQFNDNFTEYLWLNDGDLYYPTVLFYEEEVEVEGVDGALRAELYAIDEETETIVHAASGYYTVDSLTGVNIYDYTTLKIDEAFKGDMFESFSCMVASVRGNRLIDVYYMLAFDGEACFAMLPEYSVPEGVDIWGDEEVTLEEAGNYLLFNVGGDPGVEGLGSLYVMTDPEEEQPVLLSATEGSVATYEYDSLEGRLYLQFIGYTADGELDLSFLFLTLTGQDGPVELIVAVDYLPMELYPMEPDGTVNDYDIAMTLDGMGNAIYYYYEIEEGFWGPQYNLVGTVNGKVQITGKTLFDGDIYTFTAAENEYGISTKEFITEYYVMTSFWGTTALYLYHEKTTEALTLTGDQGTLELDGFVYLARYTDAEGNVNVGTYVYGETDEQVDMDKISFIYADGYTSRTMDFGGNTFTVQDGNAGEFSFKDDSFADLLTPDGKSVIVRLDGYGNAQLVEYDNDLYEYGDVIATGKYFLDPVTQINRLEISVGEGEKEICNFAFVSDGYSVSIVLENEDHAHTLVTGKGEVIVLDGFGFATYYSEYGIRTEAQYTQIAEEVMLILFEDSSSLLLHLTEGEGNVNCVAVDNSAYVKTYYASDLSAIVFLQNVVQLDGTAAYYEVSADGKTATLYSQQEDGSYTVSTLNMPQGDTIEYHDKTFRLWTEKELTFTSTGEFLPDITIRFTPDGTGEYTVPMFFMDEKYDGMFEMDVYYNYLGEWTVEIIYDDMSDWIYISLNCDFAKGTGTFTFLVDESELTEYVEAESGNTLYVYEGAFSVLFFYTLKIGDETVIVMTEGDLSTFATEETDETYGTIYELKADGKSYRFCVGETEEGDGVLYLLEN